MISGVCNVLGENNTNRCQTIKQSPDELVPHRIIKKKNKGSNKVKMQKQKKPKQSNVSPNDRAFMSIHENQSAGGDKQSQTIKCSPRKNSPKKITAGPSLRGSLNFEVRKNELLKTIDGNFRMLHKIYHAKPAVQTAQELQRHSLRSKELKQILDGSKRQYLIQAARQLAISHDFTKEMKKRSKERQKQRSIYSNNNLYLDGDVHANHSNKGEQDGQDEEAKEVENKQFVSNPLLSDNDREKQLLFGHLKSPDVVSKNFQSQSFQNPPWKTIMQNETLVSGRDDEQQANNNVKSVNDICASPKERVLLKKPKSTIPSRRPLTNQHNSIYKNFKKINIMNVANQNSVFSTNAKKQQNETQQLFYQLSDRSSQMVEPQYHAGTLKIANPIQTLGHDSPSEDDNDLLSKAYFNRRLNTNKNRNQKTIAQIQRWKQFANKYDTQSKKAYTRYDRTQSQISSNYDGTPNMMSGSRNLKNIDFSGLDQAIKSHNRVPQLNIDVHKKFTQRSAGKVGTNFMVKRRNRQYSNMMAVSQVLLNRQLSNRSKRASYQQNNSNYNSVTIQRDCDLPSIANVQMYSNQYQIANLEDRQSKTTKNENIISSRRGADKNRKNSDVSLTQKTGVDTSIKQSITNDHGTNIGTNVLSSAHMQIETDKCDKLTPVQSQIVNLDEESTVNYDDEGTANKDKVEKDDNSEDVVNLEIEQPMINELDSTPMMQKSMIEEPQFNEDAAPVVKSVMIQQPQPKQDQDPFVKTMHINKQHLQDINQPTIEFVENLIPFTQEMTSPSAQKQKDEKKQSTNDVCGQHQLASSNKPKIIKKNQDAPVPKKAIRRQPSSTEQQTQVIAKNLKIRQPKTKDQRMSAIRNIQKKQSKIKQDIEAIKQSETIKQLQKSKEETTSSTKSKVALPGQQKSHMDLTADASQQSGLPEVFPKPLDQRIQQMNKKTIEVQVDAKYVTQEELQKVKKDILQQVETSKHTYQSKLPESKINQRQNFILHQNQLQEQKTVQMEIIQMDDPKFINYLQQQKNAQNRYDNNSINDFDQKIEPQNDKSLSELLLEQSEQFTFEKEVKEQQRIHEMVESPDRRQPLNKNQTTKKERVEKLDMKQVEVQNQINEAQRAAEKSVESQNPYTEETVRKQFQAPDHIKLAMPMSETTGQTHEMAQSIIEQEVTKTNENEEQTLDQNSLRDEMVSVKGNDSIDTSQVLEITQITKFGQNINHKSQGFRQSCSLEESTLKSYQLEDCGGQSPIMVNDQSKEVTFDLHSFIMDNGSMTNKNTYAQYFDQQDQLESSQLNDEEKQKAHRVQQLLLEAERLMLAEEHASGEVDLNTNDAANQYLTHAAFVRPSEKTSDTVRLIVIHSLSHQQYIVKLKCKNDKIKIQAVNLNCLQEEIYLKNYFENEHRHVSHLDAPVFKTHTRDLFLIYHISKLTKDVDKTKLQQFFNNSMKIETDENGRIENVLFEQYKHAGQNNFLDTKFYINKDSIATNDTLIEDLTIFDNKLDIIDQKLKKKKVDRMLRMFKSQERIRASFKQFSQTNYYNCYKRGKEMQHDYIKRADEQQLLRSSSSRESDPIMPENVQDVATRVTRQGMFISSVDKAYAFYYKIHSSKEPSEKDHKVTYCWSFYVKILGSHTVTVWQYHRFSDDILEQIEEQEKVKSDDPIDLLKIYLHEIGKGTVDMILQEAEEAKGDFQLDEDKPFYPSRDIALNVNDIGLGDLRQTKAKNTENQKIKLNALEKRSWEIYWIQNLRQQLHIEL